MAESKVRGIMIMKVSRRVDIMEKASIELQQGQTKEERPKILPLPNGPYYEGMHRTVNFKDDKN